MKLLFDASSILWACLFAGKDEEYGEEVVFKDKKVQVNSAEHGYENFIGSWNKTMEKFDAAPTDCVLVLDGDDSRKHRKKFFPDYKGSRSPRPPEMYEQFTLLVEAIKDDFLTLGGQVAWQDGVEADDVIAYFVEKLTGPTVIVSNDGDMTALVDEVPDEMPHRVYFYCRDEINEHRYGPFPFKYITLFKALTGDSSDNFKGAKGFGPKTFLKLYIMFKEEGLDSLINLIEHRRLHLLKEDVAEFPELKKIMDSADSVYASYKCAKLYPEIVNTLHNPLQVQAGMVVQWDNEIHHPTLKKWYGQKRIISHENYEDLIGWMTKQFEESPFVSLDIETSMEPEAIAWCELNSRVLDPLGSELTGLGLTFGKNSQYSVYFTVGHKATKECTNVSSEQVRLAVSCIPQTIPIVVHSSSFELVVLYQAWARHQKDNGYHGFLPNVLDTKLMSMYVNENIRSGLKDRSEHHLDYIQTTYEEVTQGRQMCELTAGETVDYGLDDTICTSGLFNYCRLIMDVENTWEVFKKVEVDAQYLVALAFYRGVEIDLDRMAEIEAEDDKVFNKVEKIFRQYLIDIEWGGTKFIPVENLTAKEIKRIFLQVTGEPLKTKFRKLEKLFVEVAAHSSKLAQKLALPLPELNKWLEARFSSAPEFNIASPKQVMSLLYGVKDEKGEWINKNMGLPVRIRNKPTEKMRDEGLTEGNPKTDNLAIQYAIRDDAEEFPDLIPVLKAFQTMKTVTTRRSLFYNKYKTIRHWRTGRLHPSLHQCGTNTLRFAPAATNVNQLPKRGEGLKFRDIIVPHNENAVILALDESSQELRVLADCSQDPNLMACYIGDNKKDPHTYTGLSIAQCMGYPEATYEDFEEVLADENHEFYKVICDFKDLGKKTNFTVEYGAFPPKVAETLMVSEADARIFIDAKYAQFKRVEEWKDEVIFIAKTTGHSYSKLGSVRHLGEAILSEDYWVASKAERQSVNNVIQRSSAEMIKIVMGKIWRSGICFTSDCWFYFPVHDELVLSVGKGALVAVATKMHNYMVEKYADMIIPLESSIGVGRNFGTGLIEIGKQPDIKLLTEAAA